MYVPHRVMSTTVLPRWPGRTSWPRRERRRARQQVLPGPSWGVLVTRLVHASRTTTRRASGGAEPRAELVLEDAHDRRVGPPVAVAVDVAQAALLAEPEGLVEHARPRVDAQHVEAHPVQVRPLVPHAVHVGRAVEREAQHLEDRLAPVTTPAIVREQRETQVRGARVLVEVVEHDLADHLVADLLPVAHGTGRDRPVEPALAVADRRRPLVDLLARERRRRPREPVRL